MGPAIHVDPADCEDVSGCCRVVVVVPNGVVDDAGRGIYHSRKVRLMATEMKVNTKLIKALREERAWSQEHLATVAGLSARTVQRLEADGNASLESKMAIAAAFGVEPARLTPEMQPPPAAGSPANATGVALLRAQPPLDAVRIALWAAILLVLIMMAGYRVGADLAKRDNRIDDRCAASPAACKTADR